LQTVEKDPKGNDLVTVSVTTEQDDHPFISKAEMKMSSSVPSHMHEGEGLQEFMEKQRVEIKKVMQTIQGISPNSSSESSSSDSEEYELQSELNSSSDSDQTTEKSQLPISDDGSSEGQFDDAEESPEFHHGPPQASKPIQIPPRIRKLSNGEYETVRNPEMATKEKETQTPDSCSPIEETSDSSLNEPDNVEFALIIKNIASTEWPSCFENVWEPCPEPGKEIIVRSVIERILGTENSERDEDAILAALDMEPLGVGEKILYSHDSEGTPISPDMLASEILRLPEENQSVQGLILEILDPDILELLFEGFFDEFALVQDVHYLKTYLDTNDDLEMMRRVSWDLHSAHFSCSPEIQPYTLMTTIMSFRHLKTLRIDLTGWSLGNLRFLHVLYPFVSSLESYVLTWRSHASYPRVTIFECKDCQNCRRDPLVHEYHTMACPDRKCEIRLLPLFAQRQPICLPEEFEDDDDDQM